MTLPEHQKAKAWRLARGLTLDELAHLSGYSKSALSWFERGLSPSGKGPVEQYAWQRYKRIAHSIHMDYAGEIEKSNLTFDTFEWGA
jgi:transcriptional regulator with XRE-family HTH domain